MPIWLLCSLQNFLSLSVGCFFTASKDITPNKGQCLSLVLCWYLTYCNFMTVTSLLWFKCDHSFSTRLSWMFNGWSGVFWQIPFLSVYLYSHNKLPLSRSQSTVKSAFPCVCCEGTCTSEVTFPQIYPSFPVSVKFKGLLGYRGYPSGREV